MNQLASKIVDMIFERQAAIDEEYLKELQAEKDSLELKLNEVENSTETEQRTSHAIKLLEQGKTNFFFYSLGRLVCF